MRPLAAPIISRLASFPDQALRLRGDSREFPVAGGEQAVQMSVELGTDVVGVGDRQLRRTITQPRLGKPQHESVDRSRGQDQIVLVVDKESGTVRPLEPKIVARVVLKELRVFPKEVGEAIQV